MFVRHVSIHLKSGNEAEFNRIIEKEVMPLLKRQKGFRDEIVLANPGVNDVIGISIWDNRENAEAYTRESYPQVHQLIAKVLDGAPLVKTYEVSNSTIQKLAAHASA
jgi:heme-degrading monooxygenase HmoA